MPSEETISASKAKLELLIGEESPILFSLPKCKYSLEKMKEDALICDMMNQMAADDTAADEMVVSA